MQTDIPHNLPGLPTPRTNPLIVDRVAPGQLARVRAFIEAHGGSWTPLADGGYQILFPAGTLQTLQSEQVHMATYEIMFPDTARLTWFRCGKISNVNGLPRALTNGIRIPEE